MSYIPLPEDNKLASQDDATSSNDKDGPTTDHSALLVKPEQGGEDEEEKNGLILTCFNLCKAMIGTGILGMAYAIKLSGFGIGVALMLVIAILNDYSLVLLVRAGKLCDQETYHGIMQAAYGPCAYVLVGLLQTTYCFISLVCYNIVIGDAMTRMFTYVNAVSVSKVFANRHFNVLMVTVIVILPLSLYKNVAKLSKWSILGMCFVAVLVILVIVKMATLSIAPTEDAFTFFGPHPTGAIAIMSTAFYCQYMALSIYHSLENPTEERWKRVTHVTVLSAMTLFIILGMIGYATFTGMTEGNLLENYCTKDAVMNAGRIMYAFGLIMTYPMPCYTTRLVCQHYILKDRWVMTTCRHVSLTVFIVVAAYIGSLFTDCLGVVLELKGVICCVTMTYIMPPLAVLRLQTTKLRDWRNIPLVAMAVAGLLILVVGLIRSATHILAGHLCGHGAEPLYCIVPQTNPEDQIALP